MPANNSSPDVQVVDFSTQTNQSSPKTNEILKKYQAIAEELSQINQDKLRQESVQKLAEELSNRPISDFQRSQSIEHIKQYLNNPDFKLSPDEQLKLNELKSTVDAALKTSTNTNELTYNIHEQIKNNRHFDVPDLNQFQQELNTKLKTVEELPKYQQTRQHLKKELAHIDPKETIKSMLIEHGEADAETISTQITSQAFNRLIIDSNPITEQELQQIIDVHQPPLSSPIKKDILSIIKVDHEFVQTTKSFNQTQQQLKDSGINQQNLSQFLQVNQLTSQDLRTTVISSDQSSSSTKNYNLPSISNYIQTYNRLTSGQTTISIWNSPSQAIRSWFSNVNSSGQVGTKNFFQRVFSSFKPGGSGSGGFGGSSLKIPTIGGGTSSSIGNFAKNGLSQAGQAIGSAAKTGAKAAAKAALQAAKVAAKTAGKVVSQFAAKALLLNPYFWIAVIVIILVVGLFFALDGPSAQQVAMMQTDTISGVSGVDYSLYPNIVCSDDPQPLTIPKPSQPVAARAWEIVNNLQQGIWCYWNLSPDYPDLFDHSLDPNIDPNYCYTNGCNLFWCTWLVIKAYAETGTPIITTTLNSATMEDYFISNNRYIDATSATPTSVRPGMVVFFKTSSGPSRTNHVAIVSSVNQDSIVFVQSNGGTKVDTITFNSSGVGVQDLPWAAITGFGTP